MTESDPERSHNPIISPSGMTSCAFNANEEFTRKICLGCYVVRETQHGGGEGGEKRRMTMIRCRWNYADLSRKHGGGGNAKRG